MRLPFDQAQFFDTLAAYNRAVWPVQLLLVVAALVVTSLVWRRSRSAGRMACAALAALWAWVGLAYHWAFFTTINPAAWGFGAVSLLGAGVLLWCGVLKGPVPFEPAQGAPALAGWALIAFALGIYPLIGWLAGHHYPATPTFGLPCPTTIFTVGLLLLGAAGPSRLVFVVPLLWALVGATAAFVLGVYQDLGLLVAAAAAVWGMAGARRRAFATRPVV